MTMRILAIGQDGYWLASIHKAMATWVEAPQILKCSGTLLRLVSTLPSPNADTVLLVDSSGERYLEWLVSRLRTAGWQYVIVVAADPSVMDAISVLRGNLGYDYWVKTYDEKEIWLQIQTCFEEIRKENQKPD